MYDELKNIIFTNKISNIFQKHHWFISSNSDKNFHFNYQGEIADYYLVVKNIFFISSVIISIYSVF